MRFTLGAFTSLEVLFFIFCLEPCVIYIIKVDFRIFLINDFYSILNASPESRKSGFGLEFGIKGEQSGITYNAVVESGLVLSPEHAGEWSFHGLGFDKESLMG